MVSLPILQLAMGKTRKEGGAKMRRNYRFYNIMNDAFVGETLAYRESEAYEKLRRQAALNLADERFRTWPLWMFLVKSYELPS